MACCNGTGDIFAKKPLFSNDDEGFVFHIYESDFLAQIITLSLPVVRKASSDVNRIK